MTQMLQVFTVPTGTDDILFPDNAKILMGAALIYKFITMGQILL